MRGERGCRCVGASGASAGAAIAACAPSWGHAALARWSVRASAGVRQPSVLRGRPLSAAATAARSSAAVPGEVGAFGEVLAQAARWCSRWCRAATGSADRRSRPAGPVSIRSLACSAISAPWSQVSDRRSCSGQRGDRVGDRVANRLGAVPGDRRPVLQPRVAGPRQRREMQQHREARRALHQRADRGAVRSRGSDRPPSGRGPLGPAPRRAAR